MTAEGLNLTTLLAVTTIVAAGTCVQATIGFGLNLLTAPLLLLVAPRLVPGPVLVANLALTAVLSRVNWRDANKTAVLWAAVGSVPGTALGIWMLGALVPHLLTLASALFVVAGVGMVASGLPFARTSRAHMAVGFLASIMGTTTAVNGPPMALLYRGERGGVVRGTVSLFGCWTTALSLAALESTGYLDLDGIAAVVVMAPGIILGIAVAAVAASRVSHRLLSTLTLTVSLGAGIALLARSL